jgi:hypothetical protein
LRRRDINLGVTVVISLEKPAFFVPRQSRRKIFAVFFVQIENDCAHLVEILAEPSFAAWREAILRLRSFAEAGAPRAFAA